MDEGGKTLSSGRGRLRSERGPCYLLVVDGDTSSLCHLPSSGALLVGRSPEAELRLSDPSTSRRHARILVGDGEVRIADLDSHNGVRVNGQRISGTRALASGDVVALGEVTLVLRSAVGAAPGWDPAQLRRRLDEEIARALEFGRELAVLTLLPGDATDRARLLTAVAALLRPIDLAGWTEDGHLLLVLPELAPERVAALGARMAAAVAGVGDGSGAVGSAAYPADGCDAATLIAASRAAASRAPAGGVQDAGSTAREIVLGADTILVADAAMLGVFELIRRLAPSPLPVLVVGETGAGKENAARAVHVWSPRAAGPFLAVNCAALPESLAESELFGHEKGAFSGAVTAKPGLFETAAGGTLFLDEVGELSLAVQAKLLRAIETRRVLRVGSVKEREVDARIVAATHRDLEADVRDKRFRQDLFFRLGAATVVVPPLRDRPRELALLSRRFLDEACRRAGRARPVLSTAAAARLGRHDWPGNVRELKNTMEFLAATVPGERLEAQHLPARIGGAAMAEAAGAEAVAVVAESGNEAGAASVAAVAVSNVAVAAPNIAVAAPNVAAVSAALATPNVAAKAIASAAVASPNVAAAATASAAVVSNVAAATIAASAVSAIAVEPSVPARPPLFQPLAEELQALERQRMIEALEAAAGVQTRAAQLLGMPIRTFALKYKQYQLAAINKRPREP